MRKCYKRRITQMFYIAPIYVTAKHSCAANKHQHLRLQFTRPIEPTFSQTEKWSPRRKTRSLVRPILLC